MVGIDEITLRFGIFAAVLILMMALEAMWPRRRRNLSRARRWPTNLSIIGLGSIAVRALAALSEFVALPLVAVSAAILAERQGIGLFHALDVPDWLAIVTTVLVLDFAVWLQHYASHVWTPLWRLHRVHHADRDFDVTTALRFHPVEIALSMLYKVIWVLVLGAPVFAVVVFEIILNATALFNHSNWRMPLGLDRATRVFLVTPDMHRVHHSVHRDEHDTNFGFCLSIWDRIFRTYTNQPRDGHDGMTIGLDSYQTDKPAELGWSLILPFRTDPKTAEQQPKQPARSS